MGSTSEDGKDGVQKYMIDLESDLYERVLSRLESEFGKDSFTMTSDWDKAPERFPCVVMMLVDNAVDPHFIDSNRVDNVSTLLIQIDVYSTKTYGKKSECKKYLGAVDDVLSSLNCRRLSMTPGIGLDNSTERLSARYRVKADIKGRLACAKGY